MKLISTAEPLGYIEPIDLSVLQPCWYKNILLKKMNEYPLELWVRRLALYLPNKTRQYFDLKIQDLDQGQLPCLPGWHLDSGPDREATYVLMTAGVSRTEFALTELEITYNRNMKVFCHEINSLVERPTKQLNDFEIVRYNNTTIHRGTPATNSGRRLLIRVMEESRR